MAAPGNDRGIYRVDRKGNAERLPGTEGMILPNGLAFDNRGNLYMTVLTRNAVVRLMADSKAQETIAAFDSQGQAPSALFDTPAAVPCAELAHPEGHRHAHRALPETL